MLFAFAALAACADSGYIPEFEAPAVTPAPDPLPEYSEPYLTVEPKLLAFDTSGNAVAGEDFVVRSNVAWQLLLPAGEAWLTPSALSGYGTDTVTFRLRIDPTYHLAELRFESVDESSPLVETVVICQGTAPEIPDAPETPDDPNSPDDRPESPDSPSVPDSPGEDPDPEPEPPSADAAGGTDDFALLPAESRFMREVGPTLAGWRAENCAVYTGGSFDSDPVYASLLGSDARTHGLCMNGNTKAPGRIFSPLLPGGCGRLTFCYGTTRTGDEKVDFTVEIRQQGIAVATFREVTTADKLKPCTFSREVRLPGEFQLVITNNCPSGADRERDCVTIFGIAWTALPAEGES